MGYITSDLTLDSLREFAEEEYRWISWKKDFTDSSEDHLAVWGWHEDGTYEVALGLRSKDGWYVKIMNEAEGPVIQPSKEFLMTRPLITNKVVSNRKPRGRKSKTDWFRKKYGESFLLLLAEKNDKEFNRDFNFLYLIMQLPVNLIRKKLDKAKKKKVGLLPIRE